MTTDFPHQASSATPATTPAFGSIAAASVMAECLRVHADVVPRSTFARVIGRSPLSDDSRPWYQGALGELEVAARLESLGDEWTVLHSVPIGTRGSDIDHVVVGPAGVFTINSKFHEDARVWVGSRKLLVNGQKKDYLRNTRFEATRTQKLLSTTLGTDVPVRGAIVIVGAKDITIHEQPEDVVVLSATRLARWLRKQKAVLGPDQVAAFATVARDVATWTNDPSPMPDTSSFDALRREVESAKRTRIVWGVAILLTVLGVTLPQALDWYSRTFGG